MQTHRLEKKIEEAFRKYAKSLGFFAWKLLSPSITGLPDRIIIGPGALIFFIEFKAPGKKPSPKQSKVLNFLRGLGFPAYVADNFGEAEGILDAHIQYAHQKRFT